MNKQLIVATVAGALALPSSMVAQADFTAYGRVEAGAVRVDNDTDNDDGAWDFGSTGAGLATRLGFRGDQDLGNGMRAGFRLEQGFTGDGGPTDKRQRYVYVSGPWGRLTMGNQENPYMIARNWDQSFYYGGNWGLGASYRHEGINYSMSRGPFSLNIMAMASSARDTDTAATPSTDDALGASVNAARTKGDTKTSGNDGIDGWIIHAGYDFGVAALNVAHQVSNQDFEITRPAAAARVDAMNPTADELTNEATVAALNNHAVDTGASRDLTAIGINGSVGALDWYLAYQTTELNADGSGFEDNDTSSIGGFLGFRMSERDTIYAYHVAHSGDRPTYGDYDSSEEGIQFGGSNPTLGEDFTETIIGYSRDMGPGLLFIAEYVSRDRDLDVDIDDGGSDLNRLALAVRYAF